MKVVIGIDPGVSGGFAVYAPIPDGASYDAFPFVDIEAARDTIRDLCLECHRCADPIVVLEQVASSPQMGVRSAFTFGENYGEWKTLLKCLDFDITFVLPGVWQRPYRPLPPAHSEKKKVLKRLAVDQFPDTQITHATADALLICKYGVDNLLNEE